MAQGCLKCLKITMCAANFLCFMCGVAVLGFGVYMMINFRLAALTPALANFNLANMLLISGIIITCVSFLGFLGALKENRCLLLTISGIIGVGTNNIVTDKKFFLLLFLLMLVELTVACLLLMNESGLECCGVNNVTDWGGTIPASCCYRDCTSKTPLYRNEGCLVKLKNLFEDNFLTTGIAVIILCVVEVLGMCFAMTLFCHISRSGLGYKL